MMKKFLSLAIFGLACIFVGAAHAGTWCLATGSTTCNTTTLVQVDILPGNICIGSSGAFDFGDYTVSSSVQTVTWAFIGTTGYFFVDDLKGANSWYYTTVQVSGSLVQSGGSGTIPAANVYMKTSATGSAGVTLITGTANTRVQIHSGMANYQSLDVARTLIQRSTGSNFGVLGQYGVLPLLQLLIPAYQPVGSYYATLVYTLIEN